MPRFRVALVLAFILLALSNAPAYANDDYLIPITIGSRTFTLTVSVGQTGVDVRVNDPSVTLGAVTKVAPRSALAAIPTGQPVPTLSARSDLDSAVAQAVTIDYDDLFRNNEDHIGKVVRYVGEVVQVQENSCVLCEEPSYTLRIAVTEGSYGLWDDPIWVDYTGAERFLEDDIVTVWGIVEGLQKYTAVLGNQITVPQVKALEIQLGELADPQVAAAPDTATANSNANLRGGPGTGYAVVGAIQAGDALEITARNASGDWLQLASGTWIAAFLVDNAPATGDLSVAEEIPPLPTPAPSAAETNAPAAGSTAAQSGGSTSAGFAQIGEEIEGGGWRFKVSAIHKRKAVYFYDESHVAMGRYLIVVIDATNLQSGTDYFDRTIAPWVTDEPGNVFSVAGTASGYARWQYGGLSSIYTDVNPGSFVRIAFAVDLPDETGRVLLSTGIGEWVDLGDFAAMQSEDR